ncbi:MAG: isochorismatase family cysteine hydrolase [Pseudomonadota bacterium]
MSHNPIGPNARNRWSTNADSASLLRPVMEPRPVDLAAQPKAVRIDLARSACLVIDMQNDFCHPDGWLAGIGVDVTPARTAIAPLVRLLPRLRSNGVPILWINWGNRPDRANLSPALLHVYDGEGSGAGIGARLGPRHSAVLEKDSWSAQVVDELKVAPEDLCVDKYRMSGFWDTPLDAMLRNLRVDTLLFAGVNADQCVLHTLADGNFLGYDTLLIEDATATTSPPFCLDATLYNVRQIFGFTVTAETLIASLDAAEEQTS